jgi:hypothetical protein
MARENLAINPEDAKNAFRVFLRQMLMPPSSVTNAAVSAGTDEKCLEAFVRANEQAQDGDMDRLLDTLAADTYDHQSGGAPDELEDKKETAEQLIDPCMVEPNSERNFTMFMQLLADQLAIEGKRDTLQDQLSELE